MSEDLKIYKKFLKEYNQSYFAFTLLKLLVLEKNSFDYLIETQLNYISNSLKALEKKDLIRKIDENYIATAKGKLIFQNDDDVDEIIRYFNQLKKSKLGVNSYGKYTSEKPAIRARLKEFGIDRVKAAINVKFNTWLKDPNMVKYCTNMATMMKSAGFSSYVDNAELFNNIEKNKTKNSNLDNSLD